MTGVALFQQLGSSKAGLALIALAAAALSWMGYQIPHRLPGASVGLATSVVDLGHTAARKEWQVPFPITNRGTRRLVINEMDMKCDCDSRSLRTIVIPEGRTAEIYTALDTRFASGLIETTATFRTNDPDLPEFQLTARAFIDPDARLGIASPSDPPESAFAERH